MKVRTTWIPSHYDVAVIRIGGRHHAAGGARYTREQVLPVDPYRRWVDLPHAGRVAANCWIAARVLTGNAGTSGPKERIQ